MSCHSTHVNKDKTAYDAQMHVVKFGYQLVLINMYREKTIKLDSILNIFFKYLYKTLVFIVHLQKNSIYTIIYLSYVQCIKEDKILFAVIIIGHGL